MPILKVLLLLELAANAPGEAGKDGPSAWALAINAGDPHVLPGSWL